ncbi:MAG: molybdopterin-dependent oxidoreductase [Proteobacteria bacterium]|nr:molybdopterin-dependent oxidoreductase [Pseudomonadota bacterium]MDA1135701.1 molybdopterin-dependent oxidoreductase [Pseudomonadota bacterium]
MSSNIKKPTSAHWGSYYAEVNNNKLIAMHPYEKDKNPSLIANGIVDTIDDELRIKVPHIRKGYLKEIRKEKLDSKNYITGKRSREKRGSDKFVPITWEEAFEITAFELKRIKSDHGNKAFFAGSYGWGSSGRFHHPQSQLHRFFNSYGGYTKSVNTYSYAASETIMPHVIGLSYRQFLDTHTDWDNIRDNSEVILMFGGLPLKNSQVNSGGVGKHTTKEYLLSCKKKGIQFINISPMEMEADIITNSDWIQIRPGTDTALMLAIAFILETESLADKAFLNKYCTGYEIFVKYLKGTSDGKAKTPYWASKITGIPSNKIYDLAKKIVNNRTMITGAWALQRQQYGEQPHWMISVLACMLGQIGLPGGGFGLGYSAENGIGNPVEHHKWPALDQFKNPVSTFIPVARTSDMLLNPGDIFSYNGKDIVYPDIKLVYWAGGNPFHHQMDLKKLTKAFKKPDTVIVNEIWWNSLARHADIILPTSTSLERNDISIKHWDQTISPMHKAIDPIGDSKSDYDIFSGIASKLNIEKKFTEGRNEDEWLRHLWNQAKDSASKANFNLPEFDKFWKGGFQEVLSPKKQTILMEDFRKDPIKNPLPTPSGKIEIFSQTISDFNYKDCPGHPVWLEQDEWLGSVLTKDYPLQLISGQPANKLHSQLDNGSESLKDKIQGREPIKINPKDALFRDLKNGDIVEVYNKRGKCLAGVIISNEVMKGVVFLPVGAWYDPIEDGSFCVHGNPNVLTKDKGTSSLSQGPSAHSTLVEVKKYLLDLPPINIFTKPIIISK